MESKKQRRKESVRMAYVFFDGKLGERQEGKKPQRRGPKSPPTGEPLQNDSPGNMLLGPSLSLPSYHFIWNRNRSEYS